MTYNLKLEVDGYELATLLKLIQMRMDRLVTSLVGIPQQAERTDAVLGLLARFIAELPLGADEGNTLKLLLSPAEQEELLDILETGVAQYEHENTPYAHAMTNMLDDITTYLAAAEAARKVQP